MELLELPEYGDNQPQQKSCNTCINHVQGRKLEDAPTLCWDCTRTTSLVYWEPMANKLSRNEYAKLHLVKPTDSALDTQVGGNHYKDLKIQPMEYSMVNKLDACQHTVIKYVTRFRSKGGKQDLDKAIHAIELLKELEYGSQH